MKRKIALIALLAFMVLPFGACGGETGGDSSSNVETSNSSSEDVTDSSSAQVAEHDYVLVEEVKGTCSTKGKIAHYTCTECDKLFDLTKKEIASVEGDYDYANHSAEASLAIKEQATKLSYNVGDVFDPTGMVIVYKCEACEGEIIDNQFLTYQYQTEGVNAFAEGDTKITVSCNGMSLDVAIGVGKAQAQIFGAKEEYETVCGVAPIIEVTSNSPDNDIIIAYYDGETQVQAADLVAGKTYVIKMSIENTETLVGTEVTAMLAVMHNKAWTESEETPDELVYKCACGEGEDYSVLTNQVLYVDDADMSIDLSQAVKGVEEYSVQSIEQILLLNDKQRVAIEGENEGMVYTFAKDKYEKTASETLDDGSVVYYTPYELALAVKYALGDNVVESVYVVKYVDKVIRKAEDLLALAYQGAAPKFEGGTEQIGYYVLVNDIDASGLTLGETKPAWEALLGFRGVLEGNGYTISNLTVPAWSNGLFGALGFGSKLQNINFTNVTVGEGGHLFAYAIRNAQMTNVNVEFSGKSSSFSLAVSANDTEFDNVGIATKEGVNPFQINENVANPMPDSITFTYLDIEYIEPENPDSSNDSQSSDSGESSETEEPELPPIPDDTGREKVKIALSLGQIADTGETNDYGKVYNLKQGQWFIDNAEDPNNRKTMVDFQAGKLAEALPEGGEWIVFYLYNPTATAYEFHLAGSTNAGWADGISFIDLAPQAWTKVVISTTEIELNKQGAWYMYINGGNDDGAAQEGWQVSDVYAVMAEGWEPAPITNVLLDATKDVLSKWEYGQEIVVTPAVDDLAGNVWSITVGEVNEQSIQHKAIDTNNFERVYFHVYNPLTKQARLTIHGGWSAWGLKTVMLTAQSWTTIELNVSAFTEDDAGKIYLILQDPGAVSLAGEWKISCFYGLVEGENAPEVGVPETPDTPDAPAGKQEADLSFGVVADSGETHEEYGKIYTISREQWYVNNNINNTIGTLNQNVLASALPAGYDHFEFYIYNPTDTEYVFHLAGENNGWTDSKDNISLTANAWTKIIISAEDIALNKDARWYVYFTGGDGAGAAKDGWLITTIYAVKA